MSRRITWQGDICRTTSPIDASSVVNRFNKVRFSQSLPVRSLPSRDFVRDPRHFSSQLAQET